MHEQIILADEERLVGESEGATDSMECYLRAIEMDAEFFGRTSEYVRDCIMHLQADGSLPSAPMSDSDRKMLVMTFIQALDRGTCFDDDASKRAWISSSAKNIYDAVLKKT